MRKLTGITAALLAMLLCFGLLTGCSETDSESSSTASSESSSDASSETGSDDSSMEESESEDTVSEDVVGQITYIGSSTLVVDVYETDSESEIQDYTDLDGIALTDAEVNTSIDLEDGTQFQKVIDGAITDITLEDLAEGDMVAVTTDEEGVQTVLVLDVEMGEEPSDSETADQSEESLSSDLGDETSSDA